MSPSPALEGLTDGTRPVPAFGAADLAAGHVSVVNFWASWCVPCVQEHPLLVALKEQTGVRLYGVNYKDQAAAARRFLGRYGNPFAAVGVDADGRAAIEWGVYGMPETFVVERQGPDRLQARRPDLGRGARDQDHPGDPGGARRAEPQHEIAGDRRQQRAGQHAEPQLRRMRRAR